jgi:hypothetical protein
MRGILLTILAVFSSSVLKAQKSKSVFLEVGGNGGTFSVNFDSRLNTTEKGWGYRAGIGFIPPSYEFFDSRPTIWTIPLGLNYLIGGGRHYLETGLGVTPYFFNGTTTTDIWGIYRHDKGAGVLFIPSAGYRYAPPGKAFQGRLFVSPVIAAGGTSFYWGFSGGYKF